ncbi:Methyltransferase-like protein 6, partial [Ananas comosus]
ANALGFCFLVRHTDHCFDHILFQVGCGAGNTLSPLLNAFPDIFVHACDFSPHAVELLKEQGTFKSDRMNAFVCDVTVDDLCNKIEPASVDIVTMIFMLSAVPPVKMPLVLQNIINVLKPGGFLLFRDYAMGDFAQVDLLISF